MIVCKRVYFSGRVQGVGFRYTTHTLAQNFAVAGFVRNLPSGDVELVAEGEAEEVQRFLGALLNRMARYVRDHTIQDETPGSYQVFEIRA